MTTPPGREQNWYPVSRLGWLPPTAAPGRKVFVGRVAELAFLDEAAAAARGGQPTVVLVEGEAGIGKSTLLARFASGFKK